MNMYNPVRRDKALKREGFEEYSLIQQKAIVFLKPMQYTGKVIAYTLCLEFACTV